MKKLLRKFALLLMAAVVFAGMNTANASAASKVIVHVKDGADWGTVNIYNWGDAGEILAAWPGTEMAPEADGWFTYTVETDNNLNLVFSAKGGSPQSSDVDDVSKDAGEIWVVLGGADGENAKGISTSEATLYTAPEEGWPSAAADTSADTSIVAATDNSSDSTDNAADTTEAASDMPKTGESAPYAAIAFFTMAAASVVLVIALKKKEDSYHN